MCCSRRILPSPTSIYKLSTALYSSHLGAATDFVFDFNSQEIMVGSLYQAKIPPLSSHTYQERGKLTFYKIFQAPSHFRWFKAPLCRVGTTKICLWRLQLEVSVKKNCHLPSLSLCRLHCIHPHYIPLPLFFDPLACSSEDQCLWKPGVLPMQEVEEFLLTAQTPYGQEGAACTVRDNQQVWSLYSVSQKTLWVVYSSGAASYTYVRPAMWSCVVLIFSLTAFVRKCVPIVSRLQELVLFNHISPKWLTSHNEMQLIEDESFRV